MRRVVVLVLCGCASVTWQRRSSTDAEWRRDHYECTRESRAPFAGQDHQRVSVQGEIDRMYALCLEARGWRAVESSILADVLSPDPARPKDGGR